MAELETLLTEVWNPDTRPLAEEAWKCYNSGTIRASIAATWTAVCADIISKIMQLAEDGEPGAVTFRTQIVNAQNKGLTTEGVREMQTIEGALLEKAKEFELIDSIDTRELERIKEDRNLCVHPSLRSFSEIYEPRPEVARAHLAAALTTLLVHPPTQGGKIFQAFIDYTSATSFVPVASHIQAAFFDNVRAAARKNIAQVAAKHALCEISTDGHVSAAEFANRAAIVLSAFALRDRELVKSAITRQAQRFQALHEDKLLRALVRLGDEDYFWDIVDDPLATRLGALLSKPPSSHESEPLGTDAAQCLAMVGSSYARGRLPVLETLFDSLPKLHRMNVVSARPSPYFVPAILGFIEEAGSWRVGEQSGQLLLQHSAFLSVEQLRSALTSWANNGQCRNASQMPDVAERLFHETTHLGTEQAAAFVDFLTNVQSLSAAGDSYYRYPALEGALRAADHIS